MNEIEKKRQYNERILNVKHGSFTQLVFSSMEGMGRESQVLFKSLSESFSDSRVPGCAPDLRSNYQFVEKRLRCKIVADQIIDIARSATERGVKGVFISSIAIRKQFRLQKRANELNDILQSFFKRERLYIY